MEGSYLGQQLIEGHADWRVIFDYQLIIRIDGTYAVLHLLVLLSVFANGYATAQNDYHGSAAVVQYSMLCAYARQCSVGPLDMGDLR